MLCFIFSLHAVVAADADVDDTNGTALATADVDDVVKQSDDPPSLTLPNNNTVLSEGEDSFSSLKSEIQNGGTVHLNKSYKYGSSDTALVNGINIENDLTLIGDGTTVIDGNKQARIFNIKDGVTVTLQGITFKNGHSTGNGGAIYSLGILNVIDCKFINNTADFNNDDDPGHGGAIYLDHSTSSDIEGTTFTGNVAAYNGGAIDWHANSQNGRIANSIFTDNTAKRSGGAIHWSGHYGTITNSNFTRNIATGEVNSTIGGVPGGGDGGAVLWVGSHGIINNNCNFSDNFAQYRGGAIYLHGNTTENCTNTTVDGCKFENNIAGLNGGAIDWQKGAQNGTLSNSIFTNNTAWRSGGAVYWYGYNGTIKNCNFTDSHAIGNISKHPKNLTNYTTEGGNGGAVIWTGNVGLIDNCNFKYSTAPRLGGAVFIQQNTNIVIKRSHFTNNTAGLNGGAIDFFRGAANGKIIDSIGLVVLYSGLVSMVLLNIQHSITIRH